VPIYLAQVRHLDAVQIGTIMSVGGLAMFIASPISGRLIGRIDVRLHIAIGLLLCGASFWISAGITKDWDFDELLWPQILRSFGLMFCMPPATRLAIGTLPLAQVKNASGLYNLMRMLGGAIGLATINTMLQSRGSHHWSRLVEHVNPARPETQAYIERLQEKAGSLVGVEPQAFAVRQIAGLVQREAAVMSFADAFHLIALGFILLAPVMLLAKPMGAPAAGAPAAPTPAPAGARP
jgi:DHA2 family multidrug resistance protein